MQTQKTKDQQ